MLLNLRTKDNIWLGVCCWVNHVSFNSLTKGIVWHGSLADAIAPPLRPPRSVRHPASELLLLPLSLGATSCLHWPLKLLPLRCWLRLLPLRRWLHRRRHCRRASIAIVVGCDPMNFASCMTPQSVYEARPLPTCGQLHNLEISPFLGSSTTEVKCGTTIFCWTQPRKRDSPVPMGLPNVKAAPTPMAQCGQCASY